MNGVAIHRSILAITNNTNWGFSNDKFTVELFLLILEKCASRINKHTAAQTLSRQTKADSVFFDVRMIQITQN